MASSSGTGHSMPGVSGPSGSGDGAFSQFMTEVKEIEERDSVLTPQQQIDRLLRPGSTYFNLNPFEVLQVNPDIPIEQIKKHYRKMSILVHPDKNPDNRDRAQQAFEILSKAMKTLNDDKERQAALEMIKEAKEKTEFEMTEERKQLKRDGKPAELPEDVDPNKDQSVGSSTSTPNEQHTQKQKKTPAQETLRANITELELKVERLLQQSRESDDLQGCKDLKAAEDELKRAKQKLSWLEGNAAYQKKYREKRKRDLEEIKEKHPLVALELRPGKRTKSKEADLKDEEDGVHHIDVVPSEMKKPVQEEIATKIMRLDEELTALRQALVKKAKTYILGNGKTMSRKDLKELIGAKKLELTNEKTKLTTLQANAIRQKKYRDRKKKQLEDLQKTHPQVASKLPLRNKRGRPRIEESQPDLLTVLEEVAGATTEENKKTDVTKPVLTGKTLRDLTIEMKQRGFKLSRSAAYLRLAPKQTESSEGKRHVKYVPVKLRPQTGHGKQHLDSKFAAASIQYVQELTATLGPQVVGYVIQDNGCRVRFKASGENSSEHMVLDYRAPQSDSEAMRLKSLDGTKLVLSLYGACKIDKNGMGEADKVTKFGPTYIAVRSGRHLASTAYAHWDDYNIVVQRPEFKNFLRRRDGSVKPVMVLFVSGSHDENPHSAKALQVAACHFKVHNLDAMFIVSDAPGNRGPYYHPAERRVQVLTECLSKLALPRNHYTSHLDEHGHCIDDTLEKHNFKAAGETLSEVWSEASCDTHPIIAKYVEPSDEPEGRRWEGVNHDERWKAEHVRQSQYCLQIVRCDNDVCCGPWRSDLKGILSERFIPPPIPFTQGDNGPEAPEPNQLGYAQYGSLAMRIAMSSVLPRSVQKFRIIPYDFYCPSLQAHLNQRICRWCGLYHVSQKALRPHTRIHSSTETSQQQSATTADVPVQIEKLTELVEAAVATEVVVSEPAIQVQVQAQPHIQVQNQSVVPAPQVQVQVQTTPGAAHEVLSGTTVVCMPEWSTTSAQWTTSATTTEQRQPQFRERLYKTTVKLFADYELRRRSLMERDAKERKREREVEIEQEEKVKKQKEWEKDWEQRRDDRVTSWRDFSQSSSKKKKSKNRMTFKPPKPKLEKSGK